MTIFVPHIPKCGGTTLKRILEDHLNCFFDYDHPPSYLPYFQKESERRDREFSQLSFEPFQVVYGHYPLRRYRHEGRVCLLLRHPIDRLVSHFNYFKYLMPATNLVAIAKQPIISEVKNGLSIVEFAERTRMDRFYGGYLDYVDTRDFLVVERYEQYPSFIARVRDLLGLPPAPAESLPSLRRNDQKEPLTPDEQRHLQLFLKEEIDYFHDQVGQRT